MKKFYLLAGSVLAVTVLSGCGPQADVTLKV
jgi:hypothetical protein